MWIYRKIMLPLSLNAVSGTWGLYLSLVVEFPLVAFDGDFCPEMRTLPLGIATLAWEFATRWIWWLRARQSAYFLFCCSLR